MGFTSVLHSLQNRTPRARNRKERQKEIAASKYAPLVKYVVDRLMVHLPKSVERDDLVSAAIIGLFDALEKYDAGKGTKFETYAIARIKGAIIDELRANADQAIDVDVDTTETLTDLVYLQREIAAAATATDPTIVTQNTTLSGTSQWSDFTNSNPIQAVENQKGPILKQNGQPPKSMLVSYPVFLALREHPAIVDYFKYTQVPVLQPDHLKSVFNVDNFYVAAAIKNTANEGAADSLDYIWGKNALLFYRPATAGRRTLSLGFQFTWLFGANTDGFLVKRYRDESRTADIVETQLYYDIKVVAPSAAYLWLSAVA